MSNERSQQSDQLQRILRYAIEKEQESIDFYSQLAGRVKAPNIAQELRKIAGMEVQHRERLERMDVESAVAAPASRPINLKIADYLVEPEPSKEMTWQEVVNIAMHRELATMRMYTDLSALVADPRGKQLFQNLAAEEENHKLFFERIWDDEILIEN